MSFLTEEHKFIKGSLLIARYSVLTAHYLSIRISKCGCWEYKHLLCARNIHQLSLMMGITNPLAHDLRIANAEERIVAV